MIWPGDGPLEMRNSSPWTAELLDHVIPGCRICRNADRLPLWFVRWHLRRMGR